MHRNCEGTQAESAEGEIPFDEKLWMDIFREVKTFADDTGLEASDLVQDNADIWQTAIQEGQKPAKPEDYIKITKETFLWELQQMRWQN